MFIHIPLEPCVRSFAAKRLSLLIAFQFKLVCLLNHLFGKVLITLFPSFSWLLSAKLTLGTMGVSHVAT